MDNIGKERSSFFLIYLREFFQRYWRSYVELLLVAGFFTLLDQWTRALVRRNIPMGGDWLPAWLSWLAPFARIRHWHNTGAAFGLFQGGSLIFTILAFFVAGFILYYFPRVDRKEWWLRLALSLQFCGAIGNLIDRLRFNGQVTDFMSVGKFAIFNLADSYITVGTAILVLGVFLTERAEKKKAVAMENKDEAVDG
jgi:signal peptidase II